jgi:PAS domain S-box-containing protein
MRFLVVDGSEIETALAVQKVRDEGLEPEATRVDTVDAVRDALATQDWDIILADAHLEGADLREILDLSHRLAPETPLVVVSGPADETAVSSALRAGACDWVPKARLDLLAPAIERALSETRQTRPDSTPADQILLSQTLADTIPSPIFYRDTNGSFLGCNRSFEQVFNLTMEQIVGESAFLPGPVNLVKLCAENDAELQQHPGITTYEGQVHFESGEVRDFIVNKASYARADGRPVGFVGVMTDITEQRRDDEVRLRMATLVEQTTEAIAWTDTDGIIQYVNPAFEAATGYAHGEAVGCDIAVICGGERRGPHLENTGQETGSGEAWSGRVINRKKDGSRFEADVVISPIKNAQGRARGHVHMLRDVSTEVMLQEQLRQSQKMEAVGRLAGGVAHDFNNLLTAISGYSELLLPQIQDDDPRRRQVAEIQRAAARAAELTRSLLVFSRREDIRPIVLELDVVVDGVAKMLRRLIGEDITLETSAGPGIGLVLADPAQIEQVLVNLAVNARDAMPSGGRMTISLANIELLEDDIAGHPTGGPGRYVRLRVTDTGVGMSTHTLAHIFEPFFTTKDGDQGTGLGLSTVYGIVKQSGGHISAHSELDQGSAFEILFPQVTSSMETTRDRPPKAGIEGGTESVLVVEDEAAVRRIAVEILRRAGYVIVSARSAKEALEICDQFEGPIHVLLTDIVMPDMNGIELANEWRARRPESRVIFMTGYPAEMLSRYGEMDPDSPILEKPFTPTALSRTLREALAKPSPVASEH